MVFRPLVLFGLVGACGVQAHTVTPVKKVTDLLENLAKVVEQEGKEEAAAYDKYACFCKEQADDKQYAIESSTEKISKLTAKIGKLATEITGLDGEIQILGGRITQLGTDIDTNRQTRDGEHATFLTAQADAAGAISAVERAIAALKASKKELRGKVEREALAQMKAALIQLGQPGEVYAYKYQSNDIIGTLQTLRQTFTDRKLDLEDAEFNTQAAYEMKQQALANEMKFAEKEKAEKEAVRSAKAEEKHAIEADKSQEEADMQADQNYLAVIVSDCQTKATLWDQRSTTRAAELTAMTQAIDSLKTGVAENWGANKKLVGLQTQVSPKGHWEYVADSPAPSFLQMRGQLRGTSDARDVVAAAVQRKLVSAAKSLKSPLLSLAALKVGAAKDHFVKVRSIIKDLIQRLEDDAAAEFTQKAFCDKEMGDAVAKRDTEQSKVEDTTAQIAGKEAAKAQLKREIAELQAQIAQNKKELLEAQTLRDAEKEENTKTITDAGNGKASVEFAIQVLSNFYTNAALVQRSSYVPPNSDRSGKTVGDRAPEIFDSEYKGSQNESKGIIGILEVILSDFERTATKVTTDEGTAVVAFTGFKNVNEADTTTREGSVTTKDGQITTIKDDLVNLRESLNDAETNHKNALSELAKLHPMCVAGDADEAYKQRVAQRNKEIEALKEAQGILRDWK